MAIVRVAKATGSSSTDGTSGPVSASVSFVDGDLALYAAHWSRSGAQPDLATPVFSATVGSLSLSLLALGGVNADQSYFTSNGHRVAVWGGIVSGSVTGTFQQVLTNTHDGFMFAVDVLQGVDTTGGISAVLRQNPAKSSSAGSTNIGLTLGSTPNADDYIISYIGAAASGSVAHTPDSDFTNLRNVTAISSPSLRMWMDASTGGGGNTSCGGTLDASVSFGALALAFKALAVTGRAGVNRNLGKALANRRT